MNFLEWKKLITIKYYKIQKNNITFVLIMIVLTYFLVEYFLILSLLGNNFYIIF